MSEKEHTDRVVVVEYLWDLYPTATPAQITHMKHSRCGDSSLAALVAHLGLDKHIHNVKDKTTRANLDRYLRDIPLVQAQADKAIQAASGVADKQGDEDGGVKAGVEYWSTASRSHVRPLY